MPRPLFIYGWFAALLLLLMPGYLENTDAETVYLSAQGIAQRGDLGTLDPARSLRTLSYPFSPKDGKMYSRYGLGMTLLALPAALLEPWLGANGGRFLFAMRNKCFLS